MVQKAINDFARHGDIIFTLFVLYACPRISDEDPPALSVTKQAETIKNATKEVRQLLAK